MSSALTLSYARVGGGGWDFTILFEVASEAPPNSLHQAKPLGERASPSAIDWADAEGGHDRIAIEHRRHDMAAFDHERARNVGRYCGFVGSLKGLEIGRDKGNFRPAIVQIRKRDATIDFDE